MTGLLLFVRDTGERTHVAATHATDHSNYIAYFQEDSTADCARFNNDRDICYVKMDGWLVDSIGPMGSPGPAGPLPSTVFDLTKSSGRKVNVNALGGQSKSMITLLGGSLADTCSLARWTFDPPGPTQSGPIKPVNRLGWQIPDIGADSVLIIRRRSAGPQRDTLVARKNPQTNVIELLILNIPPDDELGLFKPPPISIPQTMPDPARMEAHVHAYYRQMGVVNPASHPVPTDPVQKLRETCPITILGLENDTGFVRAGQGPPGIRTQSCITATATVE
jgi:hypothetical protein